LRKRRISASVKELKAIAEALGKVRDQDVAIKALESLAATAPAEVSPGIQTLIDNRRINLDKAREQLNAVLDQERLVQLRSDFFTDFEASLKPPGSREKSRHSENVPHGPSFREVARATILNRLEAFEKLSDSLYHPLKVKPLHKMRIAAKELRYAIELFNGCWGNSIVIFARKLAKLQTALGDLHDCDVWIADSGDYLSDPTKQKTTEQAAKEHEVAAVWLLAYFVRLRTKHFRNALARWRNWDINNFSEQLRKIVLIDSPRPVSGDRRDSDVAELPGRRARTLQFPTPEEKKSA
jgi:CHAD domain-containing protein